MGKVVAIRNIKGGAGKTTAAINLLGAARLSGCIIDLEINDCKAWVARGDQYRGRVAEARTEAHLRKLLAFAEQRAWWAFINIPGERSNDLIRSAMDAASLVVIPLGCAQLDLGRTIETIEEAEQAGRDYLLVLNLAMPRREGKEARQTAEVRAALHRYRHRLWPGQITRAIAFDSAAILGVSVVDFGDEVRAAREVKSLFAHIRRLCCPGPTHDNGGATYLDQGTH